MMCDGARKLMRGTRAHGCPAPAGEGEGGPELLKLIEIVNQTIANDCKNNKKLMKYPRADGLRAARRPAAGPRAFPRRNAITHQIAKPHTSPFHQIHAISLRYKMFRCLPSAPAQAW